MTSFLCSILLFLGMWIDHTAAQPTNPYEPDGKSLVVMINGHFPITGKPVNGAGIVVGKKDGIIYIATAAHVVRNFTERAEDISVKFADRPGLALPAKIQNISFDKHIDLAILGVFEDGVPTKIVQSQMFPSARMTDPPATGEEVFFLGQPNGRPWEGSKVPDKLSKVNSVEMEVPTKEAVPGYSGGAALDGSDRILGIIIETEDGVVRILPINRLREILEESRFPFDLVDQGSPSKRTASIVKRIQIELNRLQCDAGIEDGIWGPATDYAFQRFLRNYDSPIESNGIPSRRMLVNLQSFASSKPCPEFCNKNEFYLKGECVVSRKKNSNSKPPSTLQKPNQPNCITINGQLACK